jgi:hypothetical protein
MTIDIRTGAWLAAAGCALVIFASERDARACGGCFVPPAPVSENESVITDEKMMLSISMTQTTLYDQINYSGSPSSFAWVLPIKGTVTVGLSADVMFQVINQLTATEVQAPPLNCPPTPACAFAETAAGSDTGSDSATSGGVTVTGQEQVGPYEAVQLHSTDGSALTSWLTQHGYQIPDSTKPVIQAYVSQGFDFLALKLVPGQGVQSMQPVRVTSQGAAPTLPLHMVAVGTGPTTGITIWVVASGRWAPSNFPTFTIAASELSWDWTTESSNYETIRLSKEAALQGRGWQIESSLDLSQYTITQALQGNLQGVTGGGTGGYTSLPVIPAGDGGVDAATASGDAAGPPEEDAGAGDGGDTPEQLSAANADLAVLFAGIPGPNVRITRMRSDVAKAALSVDMALEATADQSELSNVLVPEQQIGPQPCVASTCGGTFGTSYGNGGGNSSGAERGAGTSGSGGGAGGGGGGGGCSSSKDDPVEHSGTTLGFVVGLAGVVAARARKKRR